MFPAIAVAQALSRIDPDGQVLYVGRRGGMEEQIIPTYDIGMETIVPPKLDMEQLWRNWSVPFILPRALAQALMIVSRFRPQVVLGTGGYVSAPVIMAAAARRVPIVLQEQNALPGRTTRLLSRMATVVATAYPQSAGYLRTRAVITGTPVRREFSTPRVAFPPRPRSLLVLGGSQGARRINQAVLAALPELVGRAKLEVWHQTGERDFVLVREAAANLAGPVADHYHPFPFAPDLAARIYEADVVLARAGAGTLSEVSAAGIPMVLVPGPFAGGHQKLNAIPFAEAGAAIIIPDEACDGPRLAQILTAIADDAERYAQMVAAMHALGRPSAADAVARILQEVARSA
ncbi:MAG: undecaprenyldiphospho-muramoylpentapeptide beta-N-acetylglucosaminyltransferase [Candidatus Dormibacteraeota bacterium]|nr:undecaprenyldiphospho-muramoylpentapeptide beta-N-acetylglucosaminyltransferase [Candidatus Dormibacteraeota bacterium]